LGKNIGDDLAEGKLTLPLIYIIKNGTAGQAELVKAAIRTGGLDSLDNILAAIADTGAIEYTLNRAKAYVNDAIASLVSVSDSEYKKAMTDLAWFAVSRNY
jgi:octaprenyl-diphosphate synthase